MGEARVIELNVIMKSTLIKIDVVGLCSVTHRCTGCKGESKCCCSSYEVTIKKSEMERIIRYLPNASIFCPHLKCSNGYNNIFENLSKGLFSIDTTEDGLCLFAYFNNDKILCSLHTVSKKLRIPLINIKPISCILWPLVISESDTPILSVHDDAFEFKCNKHQNSDKLSLCSSIAQNIEIVLGKNFRQELEKAVNKGMHWTRIPFHIPIANDL